MSRPEKWKDDFLHIAKHACILGATDQEIADILEVSVRTIYYWRACRPEFAEALKAGKEFADDRVERSLYQKAIGYEQDEVKIFMPGGAEEPVYAPFRAKIAPDTTAAIFWLKNRRSQEWRDKQEVGVTDKEGNDVASDPLDIARRVAFLLKKGAQAKGG